MKIKIKKNILKKYNKVLIIALITGIIFAIILHIGSKIELNFEYQPFTSTKNINDTEIRVSYIETGYTETLEAFTYAGGSLFKTRKLSHMAVYISHPKGDILFDTGLGEKIDAEFDEMQGWLKPFFKYTKKKPAKSVLNQKKINIYKVFLSHLHWDHASGVQDFPDAEFFTTKEEYDFAFSKNALPPAYIHSQYESNNIHWNFINFNSGPYEIFKNSFDLYGDGSIVFVRLQGHSKGSIGMFVNISSSKRLLFTGDLSWVIEGFSTPAEKFYISSILVDDDRKATREQIFKISLLMKNKPQIQIIPAHDSDAYRDLNYFTFVNEKND